MGASLKGEAMITSTDSKLDTILEAIKNLELRVARIESGGSHASVDGKTAALAATKKLSMKEFLLERPPTTDIQRTLAVGYFLETYAGMASFTKTELEKGYRDAKEPTPSNIGVNIKRVSHSTELLRDAKEVGVDHVENQTHRPFAFWRSLRC